MASIKEMGDTFKPGEMRTEFKSFILNLKYSGHNVEKLGQCAETILIDGDWYDLGIDPEGQFYAEDLNR